MTTIKTNTVEVKTNEVELTQYEKAQFVIEALRELNSYQMCGFDFDGPNKVNGMFNIQLYKAVNAEWEDDTCHFLVITESLGGNRLLTAQLYEDCAIINNEEGSISDLIAQADAAMRKYTDDTSLAFFGE